MEWRESSGPEYREQPTCPGGHAMPGNRIISTEDILEEDSVLLRKLVLVLFLVDKTMTANCYKTDGQRRYS